MKLILLLISLILFLGCSPKPTPYLIVTKNIKPLHIKARPIKKSKDVMLVKFATWTGKEPIDKKLLLYISKFYKTVYGEYNRCKANIDLNRNDIK